MDDSFGVNGRVRLELEFPSEAYAVAVQDDGKIVVTGEYLYSPYQGRYDFLMVRLGADGQLDQEFTGLVVSDEPETGTAIFLQETFGLSLGDAHDWVMGHLGTPREIYEICSKNDITSAMLADIVQTGSPEPIGAAQVEAWLAGQGLPSLEHEQQTKAFLAQQFGSSIGDARTWVMDNLDNPSEIYQVCATNSVTSAMLADIVQAGFPDVTVTGVTVDEWLNSQGMPALS